MGTTDEIDIGQVFVIGPAGGDLPSKLEVFDEWGDSRIRIGYRFCAIPLAELSPMVQVEAAAARTAPQPAPVPEPDPALTD
jgi:hypothetical protein